MANVEKEFECKLETKGYHLQITVRTTILSQVEKLARHQAAFLFKKIHGVDRTARQFKVVEVREKRQFD